MRTVVFAILIGMSLVSCATAAPVVLTLGGTFYEGAPQYEIVADNEVVGIGTVGAEHGDVAIFEIGDATQLAIRFVNDLAGPKDEDGKRPPGTDRNLIIESIEYRGERWLGKQLLGPTGVSKAGDFAVVGINQTVPIFDSLLSGERPSCDGMEVHITGFEKGEVLPNKAVLSALDKVVATSGCSAIITGYSSLGGPTDTNKKMSAKRAQAVLDYLVAKGAKFTSVDVAGWGETSLFGADEQMNRRVVVSLAQ